MPFFFLLLNISGSRVVVVITADIVADGLHSLERDKLFAYRFNSYDGSIKHTHRVCGGAKCTHICVCFIKTVVES